MRPRSNRDRKRSQPEPQPRRDDDGDEGDDSPAELTGLMRAKLAVDARRAGLVPTREDLAACGHQAGPDDPRCIIGRREDVDCQGPMKSVNIIIISRAGLGDWQYIARACAIQESDGCGLCEPFGGDSLTYGKAVTDCYLLAERELRMQGRPAAAEDCRRAYRSAVAWYALASIAVPRERDRLIEAGEVRVLHGKRIDRRLPGVAFAGPRFTSKERNRPSGLSTDNACAIMLHAGLSFADGVGLTDEEREVCGRVPGGDVDAAREVASWAFVTLAEWEFRIRRVRTDEGDATECVYTTNGRVNPYKPSWAAGQMMPDGTLVRMTPAPRGVKNDRWGAGEFHTEISDGMIRSRCGTGEAELPELPGPVVWEVAIDGASVEFKAA